MSNETGSFAKELDVTMEGQESSGKVNINLISFYGIHIDFSMSYVCDIITDIIAIIYETMHLN